MRPTSWCLGYVIIGHGNGDGFAVNVDSTASLDNSMSKIKQAHPRIILEDADDLQLYLAKKRNALWLQDDDADAKSLSLGSSDVILKYVDYDLRMGRTRTLGSYFDSVTSNPSIPNGNIHFVVLLPIVSARNSANDTTVIENEAFRFPSCATSRPYLRSMQCSYGTSLDST